MAAEAYKKPGRGGVGLLLLSKGKGEPDGDEGEGMSEDDYKQARADCAKTFFEACTEGDWDKAGEELEKFHHLYSDE